MYKQGDIVKVPFPFSDNTGSKSRPAIIKSNYIVNGTEDVILAQITSKPRSDNFSFPLNPVDLDTPLPNVSQIRCHKIFIVKKDLIVKKISHLKIEKQHELFQKIKKLIEPLESI